MAQMVATCTLWSRRERARRPSRAGARNADRSSAGGRAPALPDWPWRRYDAYAVVLVFSGSGRYRDPSGRDRPVEPGDAIVVRPGRPHWYGPTGASWGE